MFFDARVWKRMKACIVLSTVFSIGLVLTSPISSNQVSRRWDDISNKPPGMRFGLAYEKWILTSASKSQTVKRSLARLPLDFLTSKQSIKVLDTSSFPKPRSTTTTKKVSLNDFGSHHSKVTLPLHKVATPTETSELHPSINHQLHINLALRRHSHFLQRTISNEILIENLRKRVSALGYELELEHQLISHNHSPIPRVHLHKRLHDVIPVDALLVKRHDQTSTVKVSSDSQSSTSSNSGFSLKKLSLLDDRVVTSSEKPTAVQSLGLSIHANDAAYFSTIQVGTPPQPFKILIDSGSADFWLPGPECSTRGTGFGFGFAGQPCTHQSLSSSSSSYQDLDQPFQVIYGSGRVSGVLIKEHLVIAGLKLKNHVFGAATQVSNEFSGSAPFDGLMGTAGSALSSQKVLTPIEALAKTGAVSGAFMGYTLGRASDPHNLGQVTFGGVDYTKFQGNLTLVPNFSTQGFWEVQISKISVNGRSILTSRTAILDTGTTLIIAPPDDADAFHAAIPGAISDGQGGFTIPCNTKAKVSFTIGGKRFGILPMDLTVQPVDPNDLEGTCISGVSSGEIGGVNQWLVGDVFLKNVYFATDVTNNQIGLAQMKKSG